MASRKAKARANHQMQPQPQPSDYETDVPSFDVPPPPPRTNEELNLSVIRRHYPSVTTILSHAQYTVVYLFSPSTQQWEKCGIEGTLFVCQLTPSPIGADRFAVIILNRRGLDNFFAEVTSSNDVENTEEYVILQIGAEDGTPQIFGLWIFSEPPPSSTANMRAINAGIIQDCAVTAEKSREECEKAFREASNGLQNAAEHAETDPEEDSVPMGRQLSLRELFGQQRIQDAGWSLHDHHNPAANLRQYAPAYSARNQSGPGPTLGVPSDGDVLGQLFLKAKHGYNGVG